jgi:hypothetical protein
MLYCIIVKNVRVSSNFSSEPLFFRMRHKHTICVIGSLLLLSLQASKAHAYLDPGSVSLALQAIAAAAAGAVVTGKYWFRQVLDLLGIKKRGEDSDNNTSSTPVDE